MNFQCPEASNGFFVTPPHPTTLLLVSQSLESSSLQRFLGIAGFSFPSLLCSYIIEKPAVLNFATYIPRITLGGFRKCWCPRGAPYRTCQPPGKTQVSVGLRAPQRCQYTGDSSLLASHHSISKIPWRKASSLPILAFATSPLAGWARGSWL